MAGPSKIEWTEATWNPVTGCTKISPRCDHCYAARFAERFIAQRANRKLKERDTIHLGQQDSLFCP